ncbi:Pyrroline-5-carboxylate reductase [Trueperella bialowiezensis]|uniref:Pyrroline-5-carboxylate reductase n=2 Tax=Trueperella bialowiezensis TaxID=312285 RepID=A0A448PCJ6_9ACTO|nr:Pyrroline-5-carboxylate reductase [Trueperella bialowiezensis]
MNSAIARGVLRGGVDPDRVVVTDVDADFGKERANELGVRFVAGNKAFAESVDDGGIIVVGVKPHQIAPVLNEISGACAGKTVVSIAAGVPLSTLEDALPEGTAAVRVMPNVNAQIGAGMSALCANSATSSEQLAAVREVFDAVGLTTVLAEKDMAAFSAIASASPAWTYTYIDALARGALAEGITLPEARRIAAQAVLGSAQLVLDSLGTHTPAELRDQVTSPGGTTIAGLIAMEDAGFTPAVVAGVKAAVARDHEVANS